ncbi:MAG: hypothetical protein R2724_13295 [Bryobacterales bacterium]
MTKKTGAKYLRSGFGRHARLAALLLAAIAFQAHAAEKPFRRG